MSKTKKLRALIVSALCAALMLCTGFALGELIPARAEDGDVTVTVYADEGGSVTVGGDTIAAKENKAITAQPKDVLELTAQPADGYVFAYWYYDDVSDTPISDSDNKAYAFLETMPFIVPAGGKVIHARFVENNYSNTILGKWKNDSGNLYNLEVKETYN